MERERRNNADDNLYILTSSDYQIKLSLSLSLSYNW